MDDKELLEMARKAKDMAHAPFTNFKVGAALLTKSGKVYTGCNIEYEIPAMSSCAERVAVYKAISEGEKEYTTIAVASGGKGIVTPCGMCRQFLLGFNPDMKIICTDENKTVKEFILRDLMPEAYLMDNHK